MDVALSGLGSPTIGFVLKLITGLAAAGFGILGLGANIRDSEGKLTSKGRTALRGIIVAGVLALATTIHDFAVGLKTSEESRQRSERLLLSVQRGLFPLSGMKANFVVSLDTGLEFVKQFKGTLHEQLSKNRTCRAVRKGESPPCVRLGFDIDPKQYGVPALSRYFPSKRSELYKMIEQLSFRGIIYKGSTGGKYSQAGQFVLSPDARTRNSMRLRYDYDKDQLSLQLFSITLPEEEIDIVSVYSLADLVPGILVLYSNVDLLSLCKTTGQVDKWANCLDKLRRPIEDDPSITKADFYFPFPKQINLTESIRCGSRSPRFLFIRLDGTIDSMNVFSSSLQSKEKEIADSRLVCNVMAEDPTKFVFMPHESENHQYNN